MELTAFTFGGETVEVQIDEQGNAWFVLRHLCQVLGLTSNPAAVARRLADDEKGVRQTHTPGGTQHVLMVNEAGMWRVILRSDSPTAEPVRRWVTHEVLPAIRKTGSYGIAPALTDEQIVAQALQITSRRVRELEAKVEADAPKVVFADAVATSRTEILVGELAKILRGNGVEVGGTRLFEWLRRDGYLIRRQGTDWNMPTQRSMELGLFRIKETAITHSDGHTSISKTPKVTGKGQAYFINRYAPERKAA